MKQRSVTRPGSTRATSRRNGAVARSDAGRAYRRFLPYQFMKLLGKASISDIKLGDNVEKNMTILFSDIRDFTSLSESMTPRENFRFINSYLKEMEPALFQSHGFIDKYIGDAIMAIFPTSADDALRAALAMLKRLRGFNATRRRSGAPAIRIGIGLNTGLAMAGAVGGLHRMETTVISDAVNLASRIESLTKTYGVPLLISEHVLYTSRVAHGQAAHKANVRRSTGPLPLPGHRESAHAVAPLPRRVPRGPDSAGLRRTLRALRQERCARRNRRNRHVHRMESGVSDQSRSDRRTGIFSPPRWQRAKPDRVCQQIGSHSPARLRRKVTPKGCLHYRVAVRTQANRRTLELPQNQRGDALGHRDSPG